MGYSKRTKVITRRGLKNPRVTVKQDGSREFVTAMEAVSADGYVFPSFLIEKGKVHHIGWYMNLHEDDTEAFFAVSPKGWTDDELALWWLKNIYDPYSKERCPGETRLLILDGHGSHITFNFVDYCKQNNIIVHCLPAHSTHLLQPLYVGLFSPLQHHYSKAVEDYFLTTSISISQDTFYPLFKKARSQAYSLDSIRNAFRTCGIVPLQARSVLEKLQAPSPPTPRLKAAPESVILEQTPHSKCELRQQTALAFNFVKRATVGEISQLILKFSHTAEYALSEVDIVDHDMARLRGEMKLVRPHKQDLRHIKGGHALSSSLIRAAIKELEEKSKGNGLRRKNRLPTKPHAIAVTPKTPQVHFQSSPQRKQSRTSFFPSASSFISIYNNEGQPSSPAVRPRLKPRLKTPLNQNRRLPERPLAMSLRSRR